MLEKVLELNLKTIAKQYSWHEGKHIYFHPKLEVCNCFWSQNLKWLINNFKGEIMEDETGIKIKEERDLSNGHGVSLNLSGETQNIQVQEYLKRFSEFINSEDPQNLLRELFCEIPSVRFTDINPSDQLDFIHKLDDCVRVLKIYSQSAEVNHRNKVESLDLEEKVKLRKKDQEYKAKPREKDQEKRDKETKLQKLVRTLREAGFSEDDIVKMTKG